MFYQKILQFFLLTTLLLLASCSLTKASPLVRLPSSKELDLRCGEPLSNSKLKTLELPENNNPDLIQKNIEIISSSSLAQYELGLQDLTNDEKKLLDKTINMPLPYIHRTPFERFKSILTQGGITSPKESARRALQVAEAFTPLIEDNLFGGHDCVFSTVGPPKGRETYGNVIIHFKKSILDYSWATPWSGWYFLKSIRQEDPQISHQSNPEENNQKIPDYQRHFSSGVFAGKDWQKIFAYRLINNLRKMSSSETRKISIEELLSETEELKYWEKIDKYKLGYFEAKSPSFISFDDVKLIEIPNDKKNEVLSWSESSRWAKLMIFY